MRTLAIDIETYSDVNLGAYGVYKYVDSDAFEILIFGYSYEDDPVQVIDMTRDALPANLVEMLYDPAITKTAFNANFEITCLQKYYPDLPVEQWECTSVLALYNSLQTGLANVAKVLRLGEDKQKDARGKALMRFFSMPCNPTKANGNRTRNLPEHAPDKWLEYIEYNRQDVVVEKAIRKRLLALRPPEQEHRLWCLDQRINRLGVKIDQDLVANAIKINTEYRDQLLAEATAITGLDNPNSVLQLKNWLQEQMGRELECLDKKAVKELLSEKDLPGTVRRLLRIRQLLGKTSIKKYEAMAGSMRRNGRCGGMFQFYGASRSGRWSGRIIQLQNLPRNSMEDLGTARDVVKTGDTELMSMLYDNVPDVLSQLIRTALVAEDGKRFIIADFSAIEARVIAWLAGEDWRMEAFRNGRDIYCESASQMFGVPVVKHGVNGELRAKGKVAELACIAEGELVLTDHGLVPIEYVTTGMRVWDGEQFVRHDGVVCRGEKDVITYDGLTATTDHLVWVKGQTRPVHFGLAASCGAHLLRSGDGGEAIWLGDHHLSGETLDINEHESLLCSDPLHGLQFGAVAKFKQFNGWEVQRMPALFTTEKNPEMAGQETDSGKTAVRESDRSGVFQLRCSGHSIRVFKCAGCGPVFTGNDQWFADAFDGDRSYQQQWQLLPRKYEISYAPSKSAEQTEYCPIPVRTEILALFIYCRHTQALTGTDPRGNYPGCKHCGLRKKEKLAWYQKSVKVYDIQNAGRHHRYTVSGKLVHNCGYGGGPHALITMGALEQGLAEEDLPDIISKWREASPKIVQFWYDCENAAKSTIRSKKPVKIKQGGLVFRISRGALFIELPSGRHLVYILPRIGVNRFGNESIEYMGMEQTSRKWTRLETYGGKLVENCLAKGTKVLTDHGLKSIEKIKLSDRIWDGIEYVSHDGVINKGWQKVIKVNQFLMTPEHRILTVQGWRRAADSDSCFSHSVQIPGNGVSLHLATKLRVDKGINLSTPTYDIKNCGPLHRFVIIDDLLNDRIIVHNCVQAVARDCLGVAMLRLDAAGYKIVAHIHDEVILEMPEGQGSLEDAIRIMSQNEKWNAGLVLNADGFETPYYMKD